MHTFKLEIFAAALCAAKFFNIFSTPLRAVQHGLYTSDLLPTPMYCVIMSGNYKFVHGVLHMSYLRLHVVAYSSYCLFLSV